MNEPTIKLSNGVVMPFMAMGTNWMKYGELLPVMEAGFSAGLEPLTRQGTMATSLWWAMCFPRH